MSNTKQADSEIHEEQLLNFLVNKNLTNEGYFEVWVWNGYDGNDRRKEIVRHLTDEELDRLLSEADDPKVVHRLGFNKNLY